MAAQLDNEGDTPNKHMKFDENGEEITVAENQDLADGVDDDGDDAEDIRIEPNKKRRNRSGAPPS